MEESPEEAKATLAKSKEDMAHYYNQGRTLAPEYHVRDKVILDVSGIETTHLLPKLAHYYLGPYPIQKNSNSCNP